MARALPTLKSPARRMKLQIHRVLATAMSFAIFIVGLGAAELLLRHYVPCSLGKIGHSYSPNALKYGWGFNHHEPIVTSDPVTGERFVSRSNNHGWRDKDREYENQSGAFRILVLGDSHTFGSIVPADRVYTRVLEDRLVAEGFSAEVINMAYSGWGTDQELEALRLEGMLYEPDLVVLQFRENDLRDNLYWRNPAEYMTKPFRYSLDGLGHLQRRDNPRWRHDVPRWEKALGPVIVRFEVLKRLYALCAGKRLRQIGRAGAPNGTEDTSMLRDRVPRYSVTVDKVRKLKETLREPSPKLISFLRAHQGQSVSSDSLTVAIEASSEARREQEILALLHDVSPPSDVGQVPPIGDRVDSYEWQLYFALVREAKKIATQGRAHLAIFSDNERGLYEWCMAQDPEADSAFMASLVMGPSKIVREFASREGVGFVQTRHPHARAPNNLHANIAGNRAMAANLYEYIVEHYAAELETHRP